ncbi:MAG TPA: hypothetical protein VLX28_04260, partial [Thermoanaerobaculia bacterium]|nr:hypothetical protein [Thermoanaerobaculia bacterium]
MHARLRRFRGSRPIPGERAQLKERAVVSCTSARWEPKIMTAEKLYLKPNVVVEPLVDHWYAWSHL